MSKAFKPAKQSGTQLADSIRASGHEQGRINRPDTRLHPTNVTTSNRHLQCGSHPHRTLAPAERGPLTGTAEPIPNDKEGRFGAENGKSQPGGRNLPLAL
jgi:hypothetical protein